MEVTLGVGVMHEHTCTHKVCGLCARYSLQASDLFPATSRWNLVAIVGD